MPYPSSDESVQGCASSFIGPDGGAGWVEEEVCGTTPDVRVVSEQSQYYEDPSNPGNFHLFGFGIVTGITSTLNPNKVQSRGIGHKDIDCNKTSKYDTELEIVYNPTDLTRIPFITGITDDIQALTEQVCVQDCLPHCSVETYQAKDCPTAKAARFLHNMMMVNTFSVSVEMGSFVEWTESMMGQYRQVSESKVYTPPMQNVQVGLDPLKPCCDAFMSYEGDIYISRKRTENITDQVVAGGTSIFILDYNVMDFNRDGEIDGDLVAFDEKRCFRDIEIYVDGVMVNDTNTITVSPVNSKYVQLATAITPGQTIVAVYHYMYQLPNVTAYDFEINHNTLESRGIWKGLPVPYEIQNNVRDYTGNMTTNFKGLDEHSQMVNDEYFHLWYEMGAAGSTPIVWIFVFVKWDEVNPVYSVDELSELPLPWTATSLCLDNQIRLPPNNTVEEEGE